MLLLACTPRTELTPGIEFRGATMGTTYSVKLEALPEGMGVESLQAEVEARLEGVNERMSTYRPESEVMRFNRHQSTDWFAVSADTARVAAEARRISALTAGAFDCTVDPLVRFWGFGSSTRVDDGGTTRRQVPTDAEIAQALEQTGYAKVEVRLRPPALRKTDAGVTVDFSAIAKGFAVDQVAEYLESLGVRDYFIEVGGEIRVRGAKSSGEPWKIGIEKPIPTGRVVHKAIALDSGALATSGDYRNFFEVGGTRYSHTIDPRSGRPVVHGLGSVSVWAPSCMEADGWATALMVLGPEAGYDLAVEQNLAALFLLRSHTGFEERTTAAFRERTVQE